VDHEKHVFLVSIKNSGHSYAFEESAILDLLSSFVITQTCTYLCSNK